MSSNLGKQATFIHIQSELFNKVEKDDKISRRDFLAQFHEKQTNVERVDYLYSFLERHRLLQDRYTEDRKRDKDAFQHLKKGDNNFSRGMIIRALGHYSRCVIKAESHELRAKGYAKRSAALFKLRFFSECVKDIERAEEFDFDQKLIESLELRKKNAIELSKNQTRSDYYEPPPFVPLNQRNPQMPHLSRNVRVSTDENGRSMVVATKDIQVGEVIAIETPFAFSMAAAEIYHCHECFEACYNPIPCLHCCQAVYCSEECRDRAFVKYHKHECPLLISLKNIVGKQKGLLLALKTTYLMENPETSQNAGGVYKLLENLSSRPINDETFTMALVAAIFFHLVKTYTSKFSQNGQEDVLNQFKDMLLTHLRICVSNAAGIDELGPNFPTVGHNIGLWFSNETVGVGLYPFYSLLRHSCCPNIFTHHHGLRRVMRAMTVIKKGGECCVSYGPYYVEHKKAERQARLLLQFQIMCKCRACEEDWPMIDILAELGPNQIKRGFAQRIKCGDIDLARRSVPDFIDKIKKLHVSEPNAELLLYRKLLSYCYDVFGNKRQVPLYE